MQLPVTDPVQIFCIVLIMLLIAPLVFEKLKLPGTVGLLIAGAIVGPYGLGILERDKTIQLLGAIGLLFIMFIAGLEIDLGQLKKNRRHSMILGALTFLIPMAIGIFLGLGFLNMKIHEAILLGAMFACHTLLPYPIVSRMGLSKARSVTSAVGSTIITDTLAMLVLAVIAAETKGTVDALFWFRLIGLMSLYLAFSIIVIPRAARLFFKYIRTDGTIDFVFVLALMFLSGVLAQAAGLEPIIGAFLCGLLLNRLIPETSALMNRIQFTGNALFIPFFLVSVGMLVDVRLLFSGYTTLIIALIILVGALLGKFLAAFSLIPILGYSKKESGLILGLTLNHAAATLATVLVAYELKIFSIEILNGTIVLIIISCILGPLITQAEAKRLAIVEKDQGSEIDDAPERILVPIANPEFAEGLLDLAFLVRGKDSKDPVYPISIVLDSENVDKDLAQSEKILAGAVVHGVSANVSVVPVTRVALNVTEGILQAGKDIRISTILVGWNGVPQLQRKMFGGIIDQLVLSSQQMVIVSRLIKPVNTINHIIAVLPPLIERGYGFSQAMGTVKRLSQRLGAKLTLTTLDHAFADTKAESDKIKPLVQCTYSSLKDWEDLIDIAKKIGTVNTLFIMLEARPGRLAWQPAVDRVPRTLLESFPDASLLITYLPEDRQNQESQVALTQENTVSAGLFPLALANGRIIPAMKCDAITDAIRELLERAFAHDHASLKRLSGLFSEIALKEPVELKGGVVLLHAHIEEVLVPTVFVGMRAQGFRLLSASEPVKIIILLLAPQAQAPEFHLKSLMEIAKLTKADSYTDALIEAKNIDDLKALIK